MKPIKTFGTALLLLSVICCEGVVCSVCQAEERGRLPDGRAFRTGVDGTQLIDYIAELEQGIEELNRKIVIVEDENAALKVQLQSAKSGTPVTLEERDLLPDSSGSKVAEQKQAPASAQPAACNCTEARTESCSNEKVMALQVELDSLRAQKIAQDEPTQSGIDLDERSKDGAKDDLRAQNRALERELIKARTERDHLAAVIQKGAATSGANAGEMRAAMGKDLEASRDQAVESIRNRLREDLQAVLAKKDERDLLFAKYVKEGNGVGLQPSSLRARSGRELKQLDELLKKAASVRELSMLQVDLEEIRRQMADDLALVERMSKLMPNAQP